MYGGVVVVGVSAGYLSPRVGGGRVSNAEAGKLRLARGRAESYSLGSKSRC